MDRGHAAEMVDLVAARRAFRRQLCAAISRSSCAWLVIFTVALSALGHRARDSSRRSCSFMSCRSSSSLRPMGPGQQLQSRAAAGGAGPRPHDLQPGRAAAPARRRLSRRVLHQDRHRAAGRDLPFTLIIWAGPVAILQASIVSIVTFLVIYWVASSSASTGASPRRWAPAARSAASPPPSPSPARSAPRRNTRRSPSQW